MASTDRQRRTVRLALEGTPLALLAVLMFVDLFLPWSGICLSPPIAVPGAAAGQPNLPVIQVCTSSQSGLGGAGYAAMAFALALLLWEGLRVARLGWPVGGSRRSLVSAFLAGAVLVFTFLDLVPAFGTLWTHPGDNPFQGAFAWLGLALALVIGAAGVVHWRIWQRLAPPPPLAWEQPPGPPPRACPSCGWPAGPEASFCSQCGHSLAEGST